MNGVLSKILIISILLGICYNLASALFFLLKPQHEGKAMVKALTWRISLSLFLFFVLFSLFFVGWLHPHPIVVA